MWLVKGSARKAWRASCGGVLVLDDLREWAPAVLLERVGLGRVGGKLRGLRWRRQLRALGPVDVALVDQGRAGSILQQLPTPPRRIVVRTTDRPPPMRSSSVTPQLFPDLTLTEGLGNLETPDDAASRRFDLDFDATAPWLCSLVSRRSATRRSVAADGGVLVVGAGSPDDGVALDRFHAAMGALASSSGTVSGCWIDLPLSPELSDEEDGGVSPSGQDALAAADILLVPGEAAVPGTVLRWALACGVPVIGTDAALAEWIDDGVQRTADDISTEELAARVLEVAPLADAVREQRMESARLRWDVTGRAAQFVDLANQLLDGGIVDAGEQAGGLG